MTSFRLVARRCRLLAGFALGLALSAGSLSAQLLTPAYETQLESWLGQGNLTFTSVFTKIRGDGKTAADFHAAADDRGPTFTLMSVSGGSSDLPEQVIGGYNPQSWSSTLGWRFSNADSERTAFIFNLTSGLLQRQNLGETAGNKGGYQTYNASGYGPAWGAGLDLATVTDLETGFAFNFSYGGTWYGSSITFGGGGDYYDNFNLLRLETYAVSPASPPLPPSPNAVPEPSTYGLLGALALLALSARNTARRS